MKLHLNNKPLRVNAWHPDNQIADLQFTWPSVPGLSYTFMIYDIDAPRPNAASSSPYMHLLITNIPGNNISQGQYLFDYMPPKPPRSSENHRYVIALFSQNKSISGVNLTRRSRFPLDSFITQNGLKLVDDDIIEVDPNTDKFHLTNKFDVSFNPEHHLIKGNSSLNPGEENFCSCVIKVAGKEPGQCSFEKAWFEERDGRTCYNPYAVCANSTGHSSRRCNENYNYDAFTDDQLTAFANLNQITYATPLDKSALLRTIKSKYNA